MSDDLDCLEHHCAADPALRPFAADDVLVQRLAGTESQPDAIRGANGRRGGSAGRPVYRSVRVKRTLLARQSERPPARMSRRRAAPEPRMAQACTSDRQAAYQCNDK